MMYFEGIIISQIIRALYEMSVVNPCTYNYDSDLTPNALEPRYMEAIFSIFDVLRRPTNFAQHIHVTFVLATLSNLCKFHADRLNIHIRIYAKISFKLNYFASCACKFHDNIA
jgi:hypothetical protein